MSLRISTLWEVSVAFVGLCVFAAAGYAVESSSGLTLCDDCDECGSYECDEITWEAELGFVALQRSTLPGRVLARGLGGTPEPVLSADQFGFNYEAGPDVTILRQGGVADIEFRWFQVHNSIAESATLSDPLGFGFPFRYLLGAVDPNGVDFTAKYISQVNSFEMNLGRPVADRIDLFGGFRFVDFNEVLSYSATPDDQAPIPLFVRSFNALYGFQLGSRVTLWDRGGPLRLVAAGKAGIYDNFASNRADDGGTSGDLDYVDSASTQHTAFLGEASMNCKYQLTSHLEAHIGYQVMWLDGVALASEQTPLLDPAHDPLDFGSPSCATDGTVFYHGFLGGISLSY